MLSQYERLRQEAQGAVLFYRLGDFYEVFGDDAERVAPVLDVQLTSRDGKVAMCGVPHHAVNAYAKKLLDRGWSVAIAEQMEDPRQAKGLVDRQITRILTPGTFIPDEEEEVPRLAVLFADRSGWTLAVAEISTGTVHVVDQDGLDRAHILEEWAKWRPNEFLAYGAEGLALSGIEVSRKPSRPQPSRLKELALKLGSTTLDSWGLRDRPRAQLTLSVLWDYLTSQQRRFPEHLKDIRLHSPAGVMRLSSRTLSHLDVVTSKGPSLLRLIDRTVTAMGARRLKEWLERPLIEVAEIEKRQSAVRWMMDNAGARHDLREALKPVGDLARRVARLSLGIGSPRDLLGVKKALDAWPRVISALDQANWCNLARAAPKELSAVTDALSALEDQVPLRWDEGPLIRAGVDPALDQARGLLAHQREALAGLEQDERERSRIKSVKVGYHRSFGYYLEVSRSQAREVPADWQRRQTMTHTERFTSAALRDLEDQIVSAEERVQSLEKQWAERLVQTVVKASAILGQIASYLAEWDALASLAETAVVLGHRPPRFDTGPNPAIVVRGLRHPVLDSVLGDYVPSDLSMGTPHRLAIITGPNMGGKSTFMRALAQNVLLAQIGAMVAAEEWSLPVMDGIFTRIGADDDLFRGQSTFMVEMEEMAAILKQAGPQSLVIIDELGRGTATFDGVAIARAVSERLAGPDGPWTLFATHYHELTELAAEHPRVMNLHVEVVDSHPSQLLFTHRVIPGAASRSYGIEVARLAGLPATVLTRARHFLTHWENLPQATARPGEQVTLFAPDPLCEEWRTTLALLDPEDLSPRDAWQFLAQWHDRLVRKVSES